MRQSELGDTSRLSPEEAAAREEARHVVNVANAVMAARAYDRIQCACGLAAAATVVAGDDPTARTALAKAMLEQVRELDPVFGQCEAAMK